MDPTLPSIYKKGYHHPLREIIKKTEDIFISLGFDIYYSPDIETDFYNFQSLNMPKLHPARDLWNTFYIKNKNLKTKTENLLLRTHTTAFQARILKDFKPPFRAITLGRCFRHEATDQTHNIEFYQFDGLIVDRSLSIANFVDLIKIYFRSIFEEDIEMRLLPSYFPFVEPGWEVAIKRKEDKNWLEIMGAGMVHPNVFRVCRINPENWEGIAWGIGLDRICMIKYKIPDVRMLYSGDLRVIENIK